jgi:S-DNA-T family DNA segregation ATPase FtsK/SpoIIIE
MSAGRAVTCPGALELQVATPTAKQSGTVVAQHISRIASGMAATEIRRFAPMPATCRLTEMPRASDRVVVGVGGPDITPIGLPLGDSGDLSALVAGPASSGRTTALLAIADQLSDRAVCWVPGHCRPPDLAATIDVVDPMQPGALASWLNAHPGGAVLADDLDEILASPLDELLADYLQHGRRDGGIVCASGQSDTLSNAFRGVVAELRRKQTGLILQPGRRDGDLLGAQLRPMGRTRPGRGALVIRSRAVPIQVAA